MDYAPQSGALDPLANALDVDPEHLERLVQLLQLGNELREQQSHLFDGVRLNPLARAMRLQRVPIGCHPVLGARSSNFPAPRVRR